MSDEKADIVKNLRLKPSELALFTAAMKRDGMSALTTWMKSICTKYATGELVSNMALRINEPHPPLLAEDEAKRLNAVVQQQLRNFVENEWQKIVSDRDDNTNN